MKKIRVTHKQLADVIAEQVANEKFVRDIEARKVPGVTITHFECLKLRALVEATGDKLIKMIERVTP